MADDLLAAALAELYGHEPSAFTAGRQALVAAARKAGAGPAAAQIAALRRPTRSAWVLNCLSRNNPALAAQFAELGDQLRKAHRTLNGSQIRELSKQRRQLIDETAGSAFAAAGIDSPTATLREEVTDTLGAVLADPSVAERFTAGTLEHAEQRSGFGPGGPQLASVPTGNRAASRRRAKAGDAKDAGVAERAAAARAARRAAAIATAEADVANAEATHRAAEQTARKTAEAIRLLTDELAEAKRQDDTARLDLRQAASRLHKAQLSLERARD